MRACRLRMTSLTLIHPDICRERSASSGMGALLSGETAAALEFLCEHYGSAGLVAG